MTNVIIGRYDIIKPLRGINMEIKEIEIRTDQFYKICDYVEKNINRQNLSENCGTLNYSNLTYDSDILLIAFDNDIPVGYNSIVKYKGGLYVYQIAVKKEYQHKGIGTEMLRKAVEIADEQETFMTANIMDYNTASQKMFSRLGFKKIGENTATGNGFYALHEERMNNQIKR